MASCSHCSAPLDDPAGLCAYCGTRNRPLIGGVHEYTVEHPRTLRSCPCCTIPLQTINIATAQHFLVEQCDRCKGLFFDNGELQALLDTTVTTVYDIDFARLQALSATAPMAQEQLSYRSCPVCSKLMNRKNFGARSGVVVDWCGQHGVWLDNGELRRLLEWRQAGGELLHEQFRREQEQSEEKKRGRRNAEQARYASAESSFVLGGQHRSVSSSPHGILDALGRLFQVL